MLEEAVHDLEKSRAQIIEVDRKRNDFEKNEEELNELKQDLANLSTQKTLLQEKCIKLCHRLINFGLDIHTKETAYQSNRIAKQLGNADEQDKVNVVNSSSVSNIDELELNSNIESNDDDGSFDPTQVWKLQSMDYFIHEPRVRTLPEDLIKSSTTPIENLATWTSRKNIFECKRETKRVQNPNPSFSMMAK